MDQLTVAHVLPAISRRSFGLGAVASSLCRYQCEVGVAARVFCLDTPGEIKWACQSNHLRVENTAAFRSRGPAFLYYSPAMEREAIGATGAGWQLLHQHGIWTALSRVTNVWRTKYCRPTVVAPHGSLDAWALRRSRLKKRFAWMLYEGRNLGTAACLHATSQAEASTFRDFGLRNPVAVVRNGITEEWLVSTGDGSRFRLRHSIPEDRRLLFFLSRITPKKGLPLLLDALAGVRRELQDWLLIIAGVDEFGHEQQLKSQVDALGIAGAVRFIGPLYGQEKRSEERRVGKE